MKQMSTRMVNAFQKGFTLIELVIVLVVLGVLAAFAIPQFVGLQDDADAAGAAANLGSLVTQAYSSTLATGGALTTVTVADGVTLDLSNGGAGAGTACGALDNDNVFIAAGIVTASGGTRAGDFVVDAADAGSEVRFTIPVEPSAEGVTQSYTCYVSIGETPTGG